MKLSVALSTALALASCDALSVNARGTRPSDVIYEAEKRELLQDIVTWDEHSLFIRGERAMIFSAEIHPFRLPVSTLYLDLFQKVKSMGFNMVSFYVDWALLEGKPGEFRAEGVFDLEPFFEAAQEAGVYLLARPGPYINAEVSGGGFPGWLQRLKGILRTGAPDFLAATDNYMEHICSIIAKHQITNGGPVILFQPENEYSAAVGVPFPDQEYLKYVNDQARDAGIVVPLINNDAWQGSTGAPGTGVGAVDIYGHDGYPAGFDCANPYDWPEDGLPTTWHEQHMNISASTPYSIIEFQGGAFDPPGGWGFDRCAMLTNHEFARVFYKNNLAAGVTIFNIYMTFGGTNWGNLGHCDGYTSYDYAAAIGEDRTITREKYSEIKLQGQFLRVSPDYVVTTPGTLSTSRYSTSKSIAVTPLTGNDTASFFVARHADHTSTESTSYRLKLPTSAGDLLVPQLGGSLTLHGRDSKIHLADYPVGDFTLLYSTAEVFTWKEFGDKTVLVLYGGPNELHEVAVMDASTFKLVEGKGIKSKKIGDASVFQWETSSERKVVEADGLVIYLLDRNTAYNYWVPDLPGDGDHPSFGTSIMNPESVIVNGGYLVRSVSVSGSTLSIQADFNTTTSLEIIGAPKTASRLVVNGKKLQYKKSKLGNWITKTQQVSLLSTDVKLPSLETLDWHSIDGLPEITASFDDSRWPVADRTTSNNTRVPLQNEVSLYGGDYGFHAGALLFRGYFTADGSETALKLWTQGGRAFAHSVWLNGTFLGSFAGYDAANDHNATYTLPSSGKFAIKKGATYVVTVVVDNTGLNGNWTPGLDEQKNPRGILDWAVVSARNATRIHTWKLTGNLGGEDYVDKFRGPLNEGGFAFERQGYHLPSPPLSKFDNGRGSSPFDGIQDPGVAFYVAKLPLDLPADEFDIPLSFTFDNSSTDARGTYRALLYVNGFQYGRYVSNIGPQTEFPVPEGVLNYSGNNWIGISIWALEKVGAKVPALQLTAGQPVRTGRQKIEVVKGPGYKMRKGAY